MKTGWNALAPAAGMVFLGMTCGIAPGQRIDEAAAELRNADAAGARICATTDYMAAEAELTRARALIVQDDSGAWVSAEAAWSLAKRAHDIARRKGAACGGVYSKAASATPSAAPE
ncbi:MAG: hypothetical protein GMKNLPBB_01487 [Myxococcota bacterium]|nr:hypothetical protein [Myxococcota bacterium]